VETSGGAGGGTGGGGGAAATLGGGLASAVAAMPGVEVRVGGWLIAGGCRGGQGGWWTGSGLAVRWGGEATGGAGGGRAIGRAEEEQSCGEEAYTREEEASGVARRGRRPTSGSTQCVEPPPPKSRFLYGYNMTFYKYKQSLVSEKNPKEGKGTCDCFF
jgi:hypothetical protein